MGTNFKLEVPTGYKEIFRRLFVKAMLFSSLSIS